MVYWQWYLLLLFAVPPVSLFTAGFLYGFLQGLEKAWTFYQKKLLEEEKKDM